LEPSFGTIGLLAQRGQVCCVDNSNRSRAPEIAWPRRERPLRYGVGLTATVLPSKWGIRRKGSSMTSPRGGGVCGGQQRRSPAEFCAAVKFGQSIPALATDLPLPAVAEVMPRLAALSLGGKPFRAVAGDECARSRVPLKQAAVERLRCHYPAIPDTASQNPADDPAGAGDSEVAAVALWEPLRRTRLAGVLCVHEPHRP
jgi:hypothetical protein